jgi:poly-gamma-glutamate synthesis protein (capsule biosynthesis protein)
MKLKTKVKILLVVLIIILIGLLVFPYLDIEPKEEKPIISDNTKEEIIEESNELSLVMVGDCLIHRFVYTDAKNSDGTYSFSKMFTEVEDLIKGHDLAFYNQESNIGGVELGLSAYPRFNSPKEIGDDMVNLGFNLVSLVNNHTMDKGEQGVINSINYWKTKPGVYYTGQALSEEERINNIRVEEKNGIKYAFLAYTTVTNGLLPPSGKEYLTNIYSYEKVQNDINLIKDEADLIIVSMHWGEEYTTNPSSGQKQIASDLARLGVDLVIGNHAHSIQPVEMIGDTLVFYALGNFIAAQDTIDKQTGTLVSLNIKKDEEGNISFNDIKAELLYTYFKGSRNFKVYPYSKIDNTILNNYQKYYDKYKAVLTRYTNIVEVQ